MPRRTPQTTRSRQIRARKGRRKFLKTIPALVSAGLAPPAVAQAPTRIEKTTLECGELLTGVDFDAAESELMLGAVNANREHYDAIRRVPLASETQPAFTFRPPRPNVAGHAAPNSEIAITKVAGPRPSGAIEQLAFAPAAKLGALIATRAVTSTDLTRMDLDRLKEFDTLLKCVITLAEPLALEQAARADADVKAGRIRGPLHGVPYGIKDLFATKGIRTTWGAKPYEEQVFDYDATVVERLRDAGAVLLAKLTTGELAIGDLWFGGRTRNPWNPEMGSSGSSAGPAAAVAAGLVGFAVGTETGGSIVSPASTCGVVGLRTTYGRVSRYGAMTLRWTLDKVGPLARTVEDCALVLNAIYGPDGRDETVADLPFSWTSPPSLNGLRIGYVAHEFERAPEGASTEDRARWPAHRDVLGAALDVIRNTGVALDAVDLPTLPAQAIYSILNAEAGAMFDDLVRSGRVRELAGKGPNNRANQLRAARYIPAVEYIRAQRVRTLLIQHINAIFERVDVFLSPASSASVTMANLTGHPAVVVKAGFADNMPEALMITGRLYEESAILRVAHVYERQTPWTDRHPQLVRQQTQ
jgi:Asp-tRNA(Asn)/Glu-tRNA(Gln) amidotransferase A subunit family amidase